MEDFISINSTVGMEDFIPINPVANGATPDDGKCINFRRYKSKLNDHMVILMHENEVFPFIGCLEYSMIFGACQILRYKTSGVALSNSDNKKTDKERHWTYVCSTNIGCPLLSFETCSDENSISDGAIKRQLNEFLNKSKIRKILDNKSKHSCCFIIRKSAKRIESVRYLSDIYPDIFKSGESLKHLKLVSGASGLKQASGKFIFLEGHKFAVKTALEEAAKNVASDKSYVLLVAGDINTGKSTFIRCFLNEALNCKALQLYHLECDCGQSEFTVPGCLSLTKIDSPVFGDPFSHLKQPELCYYFGHYSPENKTSLYLRFILELKTRFGAISETQPSVLVVNTNGWTRDIGLDVLYEIVRSIHPNRVCCFGEILCHQIEDNCGGFYANLEKLEKNVKTVPAKSSSTLRDLSIVGYFAESFNHMTSNGAKLTLKQLVPYVAPWNQLVVDVTHGNIPPKFLISVMNANVVALCKCNKPNQHSHVTHWLNNDQYPLVLSDECYPLETLGFGIVRSVDPDSKHFYIITPLNLETVKNVNVLIKGSVCLPAKLLIHESAWSNQSSASPFVNKIVGRKKRPSETNGTIRKQRKIM